jgi:hypothetical protein
MPNCQSVVTSIEVFGSCSDHPGQWWHFNYGLIILKIWSILLVIFNYKPRLLLSLWTII